MPYQKQADSVATSATIGAVKVGSGLILDQYGVLSTDGAAIVGAGDSFSKSFTQVAHGFAAHSAVARVGGVWVLANAAVEATAEVAGIISSVTDADTFVLTFIGYVAGFTGLSDGTTYFLSDTVSGGFVAVSPSAVNTVSKPLFIALSATEALVIQSRGIIN